MLHSLFHSHLHALEKTMIIKKTADDGARVHTHTHTHTNTHIHTNTHTNTHIHKARL